MLRARRLVFAALMGLALPFPAISAEPVESSGAGAPAYVPGRLLVKFKAATFGPARGPQTSYQLPSAAQTALATVNGRVDRAYAGIGWVRVLTDRPVPEAVAALRASGAVDYAEPDWIVHAYATPNDPRFDEQWALHNTGQGGGKLDADIDAPEAWETRSAANAVIVGVVDTGINYNHLDLVANMWVNPGEIPRNGIDDDGNGYIDDIHGINAITYQPTDPRAGNPRDDHGHGTHVAGTIGARGDNGRGVTGVAWRTKLMALKFLPARGGGATSDAIEALQYARAIQAQYGYPRMVLNNSWGGGPYDPALYQEIALARDAGVLFIAAAGNDGTWNDYRPEYPASYDLANIVRVGASDRNDQPADFSNRGCYTVDLFAPGVDILSTWWGKCLKPDGPVEDYCSISGTSMATPHVAGAAALIWSQFPGKDWKAVKRSLLNSADRNRNLLQMSSGQSRLNLAQALLPRPMNRPSIWGISPMDPLPGEQITVTGSRFGTGVGSVNLNGTPLLLNDWTDERIVATLPESLAPGFGRLQITDGQGLVNPNGACIQVGNQVGDTLRLSYGPGGNQLPVHLGWADMSASSRYIVATKPYSGGDERHTSRSQPSPALTFDERIPVEQWDVLFHDRFTGQTNWLVWGTQGELPNGDVQFGKISADGRYIAFVAAASNLVPNDTNGWRDVFVHDRQTGLNSRVSVGSNGAEGNGDSGSPSISSDGRFVAFVSSATNFIAGGGNGYGQVYVRDRRLGTTTLVSQNGAGAQGNDHSTDPAISGDGKKVAFSSMAGNLVSLDGNGYPDIFLRDLAAGTTRLVSSRNGMPANGSSLYPDISADGRYVAFSSDASTLVLDDNNGVVDVFLQDTLTTDISRLSVTPLGVEGNAGSGGGGNNIKLTPDGLIASFNSWASNLVPDDGNGAKDVFVRDGGVNAVSRASLTHAGKESSGRDYLGELDKVNSDKLSADGRFVLFSTRNDDLVPGDTNERWDIYLRDREQLPTGAADIALIAPTMPLSCPKGTACPLTILVENFGPDEAPLRLIQVMPPVFQVVMKDLPDSCELSGGILVCGLGTLPAGQHSILEVPLGSFKPGDYQTTISVLGLRRDGDLGNNERVIDIQITP